MHEGVQQQICRANVPCQTPPIGPVQAHVRKPAEVQHRIPFGKQQLVGQRHERRPLTAPRHVQPAQVRNHRNAPRAVERGPASQLVRPTFFRSVVHGVPMGPNHAQCRQGHVHFIEPCFHGLGGPGCPTLVQPKHIQGRQLHGPPQVTTKGFGVGQGGDVLQLRVPSVGAGT